MRNAYSRPYKSIEYKLTWIGKSDANCEPVADAVDVQQSKKEYEENKNEREVYETIIMEKDHWTMKSCEAIKLRHA